MKTVMKKPQQSSVSSLKAQDLKKFLNRLQSDLHQTQFLSSDPLEFVHRYSDPWDQEVVAVLSSLLAYGNVKQIRKSVEEALKRIGKISKGPADLIRQLHQNPKLIKTASQVFEGYVHRFNVGSDLVILFQLISQSWKTHGSLGAHFLSYLDPKSPNIEKALSLLIQDWRSQADSTASPTFSYLLTSPADGSCCKRWCMLLRWMGRFDEVDPGLWTLESPLRKTFPKGRGLKSDQLVMPLDTHTGRISQYLGLTSRQTMNWKAALEVTESLKKVDPTDPIRYDFALARLGILDLCQRSYREEICKKCQLLPACQFAQKYSNGASQSMPARH
jgi:uncharacterized protein (TIGR02757 family)